MGKATTYFLTFSGISLLFYYGGIIGTNIFIEFLLRPNQMETSAFYLAVAGSILSVSAAVVVAYFTRDYALTIMTALMLPLLNFMWKFLQVFSSFKDQNEFLAIIIFGPITFLFIMTMVEYWRGVTT